MVCDGNGGTTTVNDDADLLDDKNDCTTDGCSAGAPTHTPLPTGTTCSTSSGKVCSAAGKCVECVTGADCGSMVCQANACVGAQCNDSVQNGMETDTDCGGPTCAACAFNKKCGASSDCKSQSCVGNHCASTCTDQEKDGAETDADCGGGTCPTCASSKMCLADGGARAASAAAASARTSSCSARSRRGSAGANDEFIEICNPMSIAVKFDGAWAVWGRGATSACSNLDQRYVGAGQMIPPHGHLLIANSTGFDGGVAPDGTYTSGKSMSDCGQLVLLRKAQLVDSVCFYFSATTQSEPDLRDAPHDVVPLSGRRGEQPRRTTTAPARTSPNDETFERLPGGAAGNRQSTRRQRAPTSPP